MNRFLCFVTILLTLGSCGPRERNATQVQGTPDIWPDYVGVTVPATIAPLDFTLPGAAALDVRVSAPDGTSLRSRGTSATRFSEKGWKSLLQRSAGNALTVTVSGLFEGAWRRYQPCQIFVSADEIDYGLSYRLIEPGYQIYSHMGIYERELGSFRQRALLENTRFAGCVNCHASFRGDPSAFTVHIRGDHGATLLTRNGEIEAYDTKTDSTLGFCVYPYWHPSGDYIAYSTCSTRQSFHEQPDKLIEVFDLDSDIHVYDVVHNQIITAPQIKRHGIWETFPVFSADGRTLWFTAADEVEIPRGRPDSHYSLYKVSFDPATGTIGQEVERILAAADFNGSICFPRPSYDGRYLMFTLCDYGTFPIWHHEADLWLLDLATGETRPVDEVNSPDTDSYHNWSANSRWFVFSSRRGDGLFTRLYIAHFDENGVAGKPFLLPQRDPKHSDEDLFRSYNVPEFTTGPVPFNSIRAQQVINAPDRIPFGFRWSK